MFERSFFWLKPHRRRLSQVALLGAVVVVGLQLHQMWPRETELEFRLGSAHRHIVELRVSYQQEGHEYLGTRLLFPSGAPHAVPVVTDLPRGPVDVSVLLVAADGSVREVIRRFEVPVDGRRRLFLDRPSVVPMP